MNTCENEYAYFEDKVKGGFSTIFNRYDTVLKEIRGFIERAGLSESTHVNQLLLRSAVIDYFADTVRLKDFHDIENTNYQKMLAYFAYWFLRRKPIQLTEEVSKAQAYPNEKFILTLLLSKITIGYVKTFEYSDSRIQKFSEFLYYNLKYRPYTQQSLELMLEMFLFGADVYTPEGN